jgi:hypothetical protein
MKITRPSMEAIATTFALAIALSLFACLSAGCKGRAGRSAASADTVEVHSFHFIGKGKWGLVLSDGRVLVEPKYDDVGIVGFSEGLLGVIQGDRAGFIDTRGQEVIPPRFVGEMNRHYLTMSEGLALVQEGEQFGLVDRKGRFVIPPVHDEAIGFSEGLAKVGHGHGKDRKYGYINRSGDLVIPVQFDDASSFSEGLAFVRLAGEKDYGYIDKSGAFAIPPQFGHAWRFNEGFATVGTAITGTYGIIKKSGEFLVPIMYDEVYSEWPDGLLKVSRDGLAGFIDRTGKEVIPCQYLYAEPFNDGLAPVWLAGPVPKWGVINPTGRMVIPPQFEHMGRFGQGLAPVNIGGTLSQTGSGSVVGGKWGYIDKTGALVILATFDNAGPFLKTGLAIVYIGEEVYCIDTKGRFVEYSFRANDDDSAIVPASTFDDLPEDTPRLSPTPQELMTMPD